VAFLRPCPLVSPRRAAGSQFDDLRAPGVWAAALPAQIQGQLVAESRPAAAPSCAHCLPDTQDVIFLGRAFNYPIALEGGPQNSRRSATSMRRRYPAGEMKHGPIALLDSRVGRCVDRDGPGKRLEPRCSPNAQGGQGPRCPADRLFAPPPDLTPSCFDVLCRCLRLTSCLSALC